MWFSKTEKVISMFKEAVNVYYDKHTPCYQWAGGKPDEYCINVAMNKFDLHPHQENYVPVYCGFIGGKKDEETVSKKFWAFGFTGNRLREADTKIYNKWVNQFCLRNNIQDRFYHVDKQEQIQERLKM